MSAATASQVIDTRQGKKIAFLLSSLTAIRLLAGVLWARTAAGYITHASDAAGLQVVGIGVEEVDNTAGASGALDCVVETGIVKLVNDVTHPVTDAHIGLACFVVDNQTVASNPGTNAVVAGRVVKVDASGVWVAVGPEFTAQPGAAITPLADLTSAQNATTAAVDLATAEALANANKTQGNALQADVAANHATLADVIARLKAQGLLK